MSDNLSAVLHQAMSLPMFDRVVLAQRLWESLDASVADGENMDADDLAEAQRRDSELVAAPSLGRSHDVMMNSARAAL